MWQSQIYDRTTGLSSALQVNLLGTGIGFVMRQGPIVLLTLATVASSLGAE